MRAATEVASTAADKTDAQAAARGPASQPRSAVDSARAGSVSYAAAGRVARRLAIRLWLPLVALLLWWLTSRNSSSPYYPPLSRVLSTFQHDFLTSRLAGHIDPTLWSMAKGLVLATAIGLLIGYPLGVHPTARRILSPLVDLFRAAPIIALVPLSISIFGVGDLSESVLIAWSAVWPILLSTMDGIGGVEQGFNESAKAMRLSPWRAFYHVRPPAAAPRIVPGINTSITLALISAVAIEMYSSSHGLGQYLIAAQRSFDIPGSFAGALAAGLVGYVLSSALQLLERYLFLSWHHRMRKREAE